MQKDSGAGQRCQRNQQGRGAFRERAQSGEYPSAQRRPTGACGAPMPVGGEGQGAPERHQHVGGNRMGGDRDGRGSGEDQTGPTAGRRAPDRNSGPPDGRRGQHQRRHEIGAHAPWVFAEEFRPGHDGGIRKRRLGPVRLSVQNRIVPIAVQLGFTGAFGIASFRGFVKSARALKGRGVGERHGHDDDQRFPIDDSMPVALGGEVGSGMTSRKHGFKSDVAAWPTPLMRTAIHRRRPLAVGKVPKRRSLAPRCWRRSARERCAQCAARGLRTFPCWPAWCRAGIPPMAIS